MKKKNQRRQHVSVTTKALEERPWSVPQLILTPEVSPVISSPTLQFPDAAVNVIDLYPVVLVTIIDGFLSINFFHHDHKKRMDQDKRIFLQSEIQ